MTKRPDLSEPPVGQWWPTGVQWRFRLLVSGGAMAVFSVLTYVFLSDPTKPGDTPNWLSSLGFGLSCAGLCWVFLRFVRRAHPAAPVVRPKVGYVDRAQRKGVQASDSGA